MELFLDVDLTGCLQGKKVGTQPCDLRGRETFLRDVDGGAGQVRRCDVAFGGRRVAVDVEQVALILDRAYG